MGLLKDFGEQHGMELKGFIYWQKPNPIPRNRDRRYVAAVENAIVLVKKSKTKWTFNRQRDNYENGIFIYPVVQGKKRIHTTQKPVELMEDLLKIHSNPGDVVLDAFMGSGTTAEACIRTGRNFTGFELDKNYYNLANERIAKLELPKE